jgi:hypothetical protein
LKSPDHEIARRAEQILEEMRRRQEPRTLARLKAHGKDGEVDRAVELFAGRPRWDDEPAGWQVLSGLAADLIDRGRKELGRNTVPTPNDFLPAGNFDRFVKLFHTMNLVGPVVSPHTEQRRQRKPGGQVVGFVVRGQNLVLEHSSPEYPGLLAATGSFRGRRLLNSVLYANGSVAIGDITCSVVVCDGDLKAGRIWNSLVIARGDVRGTGSYSVGDSLVITSGRFHLDKYGQVWKDVKVLERQAAPLGFVKFFDPAREGVEVEAGRLGARVKAVADGKPLARAGLRAGDVVTAVDGTPVSTPDSFRRLLRKGFAGGAEMVLRAHRAGRILDIRVPGRD